MSDADALSVPARIAFAGDWHMNARWAVAAVNYCAAQCVDTIVHCGDFGYTFQPGFIDPLAEALDDNGIMLLFVDGNHDDHDMLAEQDRHPSGLHGIPGGRDRIWWMPRGFRWQWGGLRWLALGGAHSVDAPIRRSRGQHWWPEERITAGQAAAATAGGRADIMVTHDCPAGVDIPGLAASAGLWPAEEIALAEGHRALLQSVVRKVRPRLLLHGHYHRAYTATSARPWPMTVIGLDCDGTSFPANLHVTDLSTLRQLVKGTP